MTLKGILRAIGNAMEAIYHGEFLMRAHVERAFLYILYTFFLMWMVILIDMRVEKTMSAVEKNKATLSEMKIYHAQKTVELVSINRISTVDDMLKEKGSDVTLPEKPAERIGK